MGVQWAFTGLALLVPALARLDHRRGRFLGATRVFQALLAPARVRLDRRRGVVLGCVLTALLITPQVGLDLRGL